MNKEFLKQNILLLIFVIVGLFLILRETKFYMDINNGRYHKITAEVVGHNKHRTRSHGKWKTKYSTIYEYEQNGKTKRYESSYSSNRNIDSVGDKVYLYLNIKTNKVREKPSKMNILMGVGFMGIGIGCMLSAYRKRNGYT